MKYIEAEKQIKALSSNYNVEFEKFNESFTQNFTVNYKGSKVAHVSTVSQYCVNVWFEKYFKKLPASNKLYMILAGIAATPLEDRVEEKKYYIHALKGPDGYLCINPLNGVLLSNNDSHINKCEFTDSEIEQLKKRDDIPFDWNKVKLENVY